MRRGRGAGRGVLALAAALALAASGAAAAVPTQEAAADFTGAWSSSSGRAGGRRGADAADLGSGWGQDITIIQRDQTLTIERTFFTRGDLQPPLKYRYALDGSPTTNTVLMGRGAQQYTSTASWDGARLVITTVYEFAAPDDGRPMRGEIRRTLWLQPGSLPAYPPSLIVETVRSGVLGGPPSTTRTVYSKG